MDVIEQTVEAKRCLVGVWAVVVTFAGLNHHDILGKHFPIFAAEPHLHGPGLQRRAAPTVHAGAAVFGPVFLHTGASCIVKPDGFWGFLGLAAFLALFQAAVHWLSTRTDFTDPGLFQEAALRVVIGNSCRDASSAALGALGP